MANSSTQTNTFKTVLKFELGRVFTSKAVWGITILMLLKAILDLATGDLDELIGSGRVARNSGYAAQYFFMYSTAWAAMFGAGLMTMPLLTDLKTRMAPLLYSKPINARAYLAAKAVASWVSLVIISLTIVVGFILFSYLAVPLGIVDQSLIIPVPWTAVIQASILWLGISSIAFGGMHFGLTLLTGRPFASYALAAGIVVIFLTFAVSFDITTFKSGQFFIQSIDPIGKATLDGMTQYWTIEDRQRGVIDVSPAMLTQRLWLLAVGLGLLFAGFIRFRMEDFVAKSREEGGKKKKVSAAGAGTAPQNPGGLVWRSAWMKFRLVAFTPGFLVVGFVFSLTAIFTAYSGQSFERIENFMGIWTPSLYDALAIQMWPPAIIALIFFATEILSRDQETRMSKLIDATPTSSVKFSASTLIALFLLSLCFTVYPAIGIIISQLPDFGNIRWTSVFDGLFQFGLATYPVYAMMTYVVWTLSNSRFVTIGLPTIFMVACIIAFELGQLERNIWYLGFVLESYWSDFDLGAQTRLRVWWHTSVWYSFIGLFVIIVSLFALRGTEVTWKARRALARLRATPLAIVSIAVMAVAFVLTTRMVLYATTVANDFHTSNDEYAENAEYEKVFGAWRDKPTPSIVSADLTISLEPTEPRMRYVAAFELTNRFDAPVDSFLVNWAEGVTFVDVRGDAAIDTSRGYGGVEDKHRYGHVVIASFAEPMAPGEARSIEVEVLAHYPLFGNGAILGPILKEGSTVRPAFLPIIGYNRDRELEKIARRAAFDLGDRVRLPVDVGPGTGTTAYPSARYVDMTISVDVDKPQTLAATGDLVTVERGEGGARIATTNNGSGSLSAGVVSANFAVSESALSAQGGVLKIFHHPRHGENIGRMQDGVTRAVTQYAKLFGPFPYETMSIAEAPHELWGTHHEEAEPFVAGNLIVIPEEEAWLHDYDGIWTFDWVRFLAMEKTLATWWGDQRAIADVAGADILTEGVPAYLALALMDDEDQVEVYKNYQLVEYRRTRAKIDSKEYSLLDSNGEDYVRHKSIVTFLEIESRIGRQALVNALAVAYQNALRSPEAFLEPRKVVSEIVAASPVEERDAVRRMFETLEKLPGDEDDNDAVAAATRPPAKSG